MTLDATCPIALLPVRLETRFDGSTLRVRIFPDEIFADTHEPELTADEQADGAAYLTAVKAGKVAEQAAWAQLVTRWTASRAAYIAAVAGGTVGERGDTWNRAAQATLPESWLVRAYAGAETFTATSKPVRRPLALTLSPAATDADRVPLSDNLTIDSALLWTVDFAEAVAAGMAVEIDLTEPDGPPSTTAPPPPTTPPPQSVDLIVAIGVDDSTTPADGAAQLRALLDAHHYTRGIAFMAPGTPTNNTPEVPVAFPPADPGGTVSFTVERGSPLVTADSAAALNGRLFADALGLTPDTVAHVAGAGDDGDSAAAAMNDALWPTTFGYFMEQLMAPHFSSADITAARDFWAAHVRPGGPLPSLRVGRVPYGVLPAVSLDLQPSAEWITTLIALRDRYFVPAVAGVPQIAGNSADPDGDLLRVLAVDASAKLVRARVLLGSELTTNTAGWLGKEISAQALTLQKARETSAASLLTTLGHSANTRLGTLDPGPRAELIGGPLVSSDPTSEQYGLEGVDGTGFNYITWLHDNALSGFTAIQNDTPPSADRPLLYRLLRQALMIEMDRLAFQGLLEQGVVAATERAEVELVKLTPTDTKLTSYDRIVRALPDAGFAGRMAPYLATLAALAPLPTAELERRFGETLDACSHRLDAWVTALATEQLSSLRATTPAGCYVGAFGWVENVQPAAAGSDPGGYVHAPSSAHAATAAILRNGYLSRGGAGSAYNVDLGSTRVRNAMELIDGTRSGEPLAALLGQRFERDLHARELDQLIAPLRADFPLVAGKTPAGDGPVELVAASNVVDGLALRAALNSGTPPFTPAGLPPLTSAQLDSFNAALSGLNDAVDGVADLLTAESIFQAVRGNPVAAAATLDTMGQGAQPPRPGVASTPLAGTSFTQRLVVALDASTTPPVGAWGAPTPRAAAEPFLDNWLAALLGPPGSVACAVRLPDGTTQVVHADALSLRPLDLLALARTPAAASGDGELDRRVLDAASAPPGTTIDYDGGEAALSFTQMLELLRAAGELLASARPLEPADLISAGDPTTPAPTPVPVTDRAQAAIDALAAAATALQASLSTQPPDATTLGAALEQAAALGVTGAYPPHNADAETLVAIANAASAEIFERQTNAPTSADPTGAVQAVFGRDFLFLPTLLAPALDEPLASGPPLADGKLVRQALQQLARVRPAIAKWRALWLYGQALGQAYPTVDVVQLPSAAAWAGSAGATFPPGTLSLLIHRPTGALGVHGWAGFVVDDWNETIPAATRTTALALHHAAPVAEAPQAILLAVPPPGATTWDPQAVLAIVRETLTMSKVRGVDASQLDSLRPFLPAICVTGNTANEAISTNLLSALVTEPAIEVA